MQEYNPIGCEHKLPNGLSAWQFQSEKQSNINGGSCVAIHVCSQCGDIRIVGYHTAENGHTDRFNEVFDLHHSSAIDAIIKAANFFNEEIKWGRVSDAQLAGVWVRENDYPQCTGYFFIKELDNSGGGRLYFNAETYTWHWNENSGLPVSRHSFYWLNESASPNKEREIAFHKWVTENEYEINNRAQITHSIEQLHEIWEQSLTNKK